MNEIEQLIAGDLEIGRRPTLNSIGGFQRIFDARDGLAESRFVPEIFDSLAVEVDGMWPQDWQHFAMAIMQNATHGPTIQQCIDILDAQSGVVTDFADKLFAIYADRAADTALDGLARTALLDGCVRLTISIPANRFRLIDVLTRFDASSLDFLAKRFVKIVGVCNCHWACDELHGILVEHLSHESCVEEANLELGMHHFGRMLRSDTGVDPSAEARQELEQAERYFLAASKYASVQSEATLYQLACRTLRDFHEGELSNSATLIVEKMDVALSALHAYHRTSANPLWLGSRTTEVILWKEFGRTLQEVDAEIERDGWYDARGVIEAAVAPVFDASRCLLKRDEVGGVEALVQPRLIGNLAARPSHVANLHEWLRRNKDSPIAGEVSNLVARVEGEMHAGSTSTTTLSRTEREKIGTALIDLSSSFKTQKLVLGIVQNAMSLHLRNLNEVQCNVLVRCVEAVKDHPDYQSADVRTLFDTTLLWLIRFVDSRLNVTKGDAPEVEYLFQNSGGVRAKEHKLQDDFMTLFRPFAVGAKIEVTNVGGGRADVFLHFNAEQMVVEVKRENRKCTFDDLTKKYSAQTFQYQSTSARLGFMLVLDQTNRGGQTLHLADAIRPMQLTPKDESEPRHVIVCLVSGDRLTPSELSKPKKRATKRKRK